MAKIARITNVTKFDLEREKAKKGHEKSSHFTKIGKIKKKFHCYPKRLSNKYKFDVKYMK